MAAKNGAGPPEISVECEDEEGSKQAAGGSVPAGSRLKIGHRRVNETGEVSYKKVSTNQLMGSIQLGIGHAIGALNKYDERDLLMQDFMTVETTQFPRSGSTRTPAHSFSEFTFRTYAPLAFRYFLHLFGIQRSDFLVSLCSRAMRELSNPGASGSIFYLSYDDEFILKTVQHKEAEFLQKLLPGYYMNLNQNPHTLLPKFFGMYVYQCNQKNIRIIVMNNLLPSNIKMHLKFDLKGSTFKRKASKRERAKSSPTYKDLDFIELLPDGLMLEAETYNALITTMRRDCRVLESFRIMDYSLLIGVHNLDQAAKEQAESSGGVSPSRDQACKEIDRKLQRYTQKQKLVTLSTPMESIQAQTEPIDEQDHLPPGGIPARNRKGERLLLYLGIIDILQSYRMRKKLEHTFKAIIHDGDTVSVHRPGFYAHRFLDFMADKVFKKIPSPLKHSPSKKGKRESLKKSTDAQEEAGNSAQQQQQQQQQQESQQQPQQQPIGATSFGYHKPDVVPGDIQDGFDHQNEVNFNAPKAQQIAKPKHRRQDEVQKSLINNHSSIGDLGSDLDVTDNHGTPSRISVGTSSWHTPTWTEGTPSFTDSTMSGSLGRTSADSDPHNFRGIGEGLSDVRSHRHNHSLSTGSHINFSTSSQTHDIHLSSHNVRSSSHEVQTGSRRLQTCSYQETEM